MKRKNLKITISTLILASLMTSCNTVWTPKRDVTYGRPPMGVPGNPYIPFGPGPAISWSPAPKPTIPPGPQNRPPQSQKPPTGGFTNTGNVNVGRIPGTTNQSNPSSRPGNNGGNVNSPGTNAGQGRLPMK